MPTDFWVKQGDTSPPLEAGLVDRDGPVVLTGDVDVRFHMRDRSRMTLLVDQPAEIIDAAQGFVRYEWQAQDTVLRGVYLGEWEVTFADGRVQTFPNTGYTVIEIVGSLA